MSATIEVERLCKTYRVPIKAEGLAASIRPAVERDMRAWPLDDDSRVASDGPGLAEWLRNRIRLLDEAIGKL